MKKSKKLLLLFFLCIATFLGGLIACQNVAVKVAFTEREYEVNSGDRVQAISTVEGVEYYIVANPLDGVELNSVSGVITFTEEVPDGYQILVGARVGNVSCLPVVCTLRQSLGDVQYSLIRDGAYYVNGSCVKVQATPNCALIYRLTQEVDGVNIDPVTGELSVAETVADGTQCAITVSSKGGDSQSFPITLKTQNLVGVEYGTQIREVGTSGKAAYRLQFGNNEDVSVVSVSMGLKYLNEDEYEYLETEDTVVIRGEFFREFATGEYTLSINTSVHSVPVTVKVADKIITTAEEIQAINNSVEALAGYYVLDADIDLKDYLSIGGKGYDNGRGWKPIGVYLDLPAPKNVEYAFTGTFDGNGHVIKNLKINRGGDGSGFNCGLFGYAKAGAVIKNLGLDGGSMTSNSYSGALVGVGGASISNCWSTVDVTATTNETYKWIGGLVGRSFGSIKNCYVSAKIVGASETGALVGNNQGVVENCYAVCGDTANGLVAVGKTINSKIYTTETDMVKDGFPAFGEEWNLQGGLPILKQISKSYYPRKVVVLNDKDYATYGESIVLDTEIIPAFGMEGFTVSYSVQGEGITVGADGVIDTSNARCEQFVVRVEVEDCTAEMTFRLYETTQSLVVENLPEKVYAGMSYELTGRAYGENARQDMTFTLTTPIKGVSIEGNILTVSPYAEVGGVISVIAKQDRIQSDSVVSTVVAPTTVEEAKILTVDALSETAFAVAGEIQAVMLDGRKFLDYTNKDGGISLSKSSVATLGKGSFTFLIETTTDCYAATLKVCDVIVDSEEDFLAINKDLESLSKHYVLTADLDFLGAEIPAIGKYDTPYQPFSGRFDGNGHTISNFNVVSNTNASGSYYNLGLFGFVSGTICNLTVRDGAVRGANFIGGLCGSLGKGGVIENCSVRNVSVVATAGTKLAGTLVGKSNGSVVYCYYDGSTPFGKLEADGYEEGNESIA